MADRHAHDYNVKGSLCAEHWGTSTLVDELGRLTQNDSRAKALVPSRVAEIISDLGVMTEALQRMDDFPNHIPQPPRMPPPKDSKGKTLTGIIHSTTISSKTSRVASRRSFLV